MDLLDSLDAEVSRIADTMPAEVIILLMDKWEQDVADALLRGQMSAQELLYHYVRMKISLHHLTRSYERDWYYDLERQHTVESRIRDLRSKTMEARRNYYVAKHRYEGEHRAECDCRGCRAIGAI